MYNMYKKKVTSSIADLRGVHKALHGTPEKLNQGMWEAKRQGDNLQFACLEKLCPNGHLHSFDN